jgi:hypothetical protein
MIEASTDVVLGEAIRPAAEAHRHVYNGGWIPLLVASLIFAAASLAGMMLAAPLMPALGQWSGILSILGFIIGAVLAIGFYSRAQLGGFLKGLRKIGSPATLSTHFRFDESGITIDTDRLSHSLPWTAVQLFLPSPKHWLLQADTITLAIPRRAFATPDDEQAFVKLAKSCLPGAARDRSVFENQ